MATMGSKLSTEENWHCAKCTFINLGRNSVCQVCGNRKQMHESWTCNVCAYRNPESLVLCNHCGSERVVVSTSTSLNSDLNHVTKWTCDACTLTNLCKDSICSACGSSRSLAVTDPSGLELHPEIAEQNIDKVLKCPHCQSLLYDNVGRCCNVCHFPCPEQGFKPRPFPNSSIRSTSEELNGGEWSCPSCTFENKSSSFECKICGYDGIVKPKPRTSEETIYVAGLDSLDVQWSCPTCTLENSCDSTVCSACGAKRNGTSHEQNPAANSRRMFRRQQSIPVESRRKQDEKQAKEQWIDIIKYCRDSGHQFVDDSFRPAEKSLYLKPRFSEHPRVRKWLRPQEINSVDGGIHHSSSNIPLAVFRSPRPDDIMQGVLGDCWFLSAMAVLGERPELLEKIVITKEVNFEGVYQVRLCKDGKWTVILIDDLLPCNYSGRPVYSQARRRQLWVPLIEKAMAKLHGCYEALTAGRCIEGLAALTGASCESFMLHEAQNPKSNSETIDKDMIWAQLLSCRTAGFLMGASCGGDTKPEEEPAYISVGLQTHHAYSVLDVKDVHGIRLVRLRNPWGRFSWTGDWSDASPLWTGELRYELMALGSEEGVFWMSLEDFMKYFDSVDVCKIRDEWAEVRVNGCFPPFAGSPAKIAVVSVFSTTEVDLCLFQEGLRGIPEGSRSLLDMSVIVCRTSTGTSNPRPLSLVFHSKRQVKSNVSCNAILEEGTYMIICSAFNHWQSFEAQRTETSSVSGHTDEDIFPSYVLAVHSSRPVMLDQVPMPEFCLADTLLLLATTYGEQHKGITGVTCYYMAQGIAGLLVVAENRLPDHNLIVDCDCSESFNVVSSRGVLTTADCVPPLHKQVLILLTQLEGSEGFAVSHKLSFKVLVNNGYRAYGLKNTPRLSPGQSGLHCARPL